jgi:hypothetical protein
MTTTLELGGTIVASYTWIGSTGNTPMWVRAIIAIVLLLLPTTVFAQTEKRIALLIGNKDYKTGVGSLTNPLNDIRIVGEALKSVGFEVLKPVKNGQRSAMLIAIHEFATKLKAAGPDAVGFLYYSGHGIASAGENYLVPTDVEEPSTVQLSVQGVKQSEVLAILRGEAPNAAHYLVLDACRNTLQGARGGKGFVPAGQQSGVLVAFATEPGKTASDIGQGSGPYAAALATELVRPGQSDLIMFHNVRVAVMEKTEGDQVPWTEDGIQRRQRIVFGGEVAVAYIQRDLADAVKTLAEADERSAIDALLKNNLAPADGVFEEKIKEVRRAKTMAVSLEGQLLRERAALAYARGDYEKGLEYYTQASEIYEGIIQAGGVYETTPDDAAKLAEVQMLIQNWKMIMDMTSNV